MKLWTKADTHALARRVILSGLGIALVSVLAVRPAHSQFGH